MTSGYSKTSLTSKLELKTGSKIILYNAPVHYFDLFVDLPEGLIECTTIKNNSIDFIPVFCTMLIELKAIIDTYKPALKMNGLL